MSEEYKPDEREAVARAICSACDETPEHKGDAQGNAYRWQDYLPAADAAIGAWQRGQSAPAGAHLDEIAEVERILLDDAEYQAKAKHPMTAELMRNLSEKLRVARCALAAAPQPAQDENFSTTSDRYRAELYDEVWQKARDMGYGNVTEALLALERTKEAARQESK